MANLTAIALQAANTIGRKCMTVTWLSLDCHMIVKCYLQVLNSEPSEAARESCAAAARPLTEAVKQLTVFASSPEFSSTPAKISDGGHSAQQPILRVSNTRSLHTAIYCIAGFFAGNFFRFSPAEILILWFEHGILVDKVSTIYGYQRYKDCIDCDISIQSNPSRKCFR